MRDLIYRLPARLAVLVLSAVCAVKGHNYGFHFTVLLGDGWTEEAAWCDRCGKEKNIDEWLRDAEREADVQAAGNDHDRHPYIPEWTIRFTTQSGAIYLLRDDGVHASLLRDDGPLNPWIRHDNGVWLDVVGTYAVALGEPAVFLLADGNVRTTTVVLAIDVVAPDE